MAENDNRNHTIDVLKGIAIVLVLVTHYEWTEAQRKIPIFPYIVNMAIPLFMVVSGYVYSASMQREGLTKIEEAYRWPRLLKGFARYTIPYAFLILWKFLDPNIVVPESLLDILRWVIDGTNGKGGYYYPVVLQLVVVFPIIYYIYEYKRENGLWVCIGLNMIYELLAWAYNMNTDTYRLLIFRYIYILSVGVFAYRGYKLNQYIGVAMTVIGMGFISLVTYLGYEPRIVNASWATTNLISSMWVGPLMIWLLQNIKIGVSFFEIIGQASYHIFLVQMVYYLGYYGKVQRRVDFWLENLLIGIGVCLAIGVAFYYVEKPLQRWVQSMIRKIFET